MVIGLRDKNGKLKVKDILDINIDMSVVRDGDYFKVKVSRDYFLDNNYFSEEEAENAIYNLANIRNQMEAEI